jgi:hypothetical protein
MLCVLLFRVFVLELSRVLKSLDVVCRFSGETSGHIGCWWFSRRWYQEAMAPRGGLRVKRVGVGTQIKGATSAN